MNRTILEVRNLVRSFSTPHRWFARNQGEKRIEAVQDVSFYMKENETLGLVGESGCGKTTTGKMILRLLEPDSGQVIFDGTDITALSPREFRPWRSRIQMIFQDLDAALNPGMRIDAILREAIQLHDRDLAQPDVRRRVSELLDLVRLGGGVLGSYPRQLSGGEKRRVGIARVLAQRPQLLIADEPVSALDVSIQAQITNLLTDLQRQLGLSCLFISHDLPLVQLVSHKLAVMYRGRIVETGLADTIAGASRHPYTRALWSSVVEKRNSELLSEDAGAAGEPARVSRGCAFAAVCSRYHQQGRPAECSEGGAPPLRELGRGHNVACHFPLD